MKTAISEVRHFFRRLMLPLSAADSEHETRRMSHRTGQAPFALVLALTLCLTACSGATGTERSRIEDGVEQYVTAHPDDSIIPPPGAVEAVDCFRIGQRYRGERVYACDVTYRSGVIASDICAVELEGRVLGQQELPDLPCVPHSLPAPSPRRR